LSAVIITAVIFSVEYEVVKPMWRSKSKAGTRRLEAVFILKYFKAFISTSAQNIDAYDVLLQSVKTEKL
jgi:hypothetical protein